MPYDHNRANAEKWSRRAASYDERRYDYFRLMQKALIAAAGITAPANFSIWVAARAGRCATWQAYYTARAGSSGRHE